MEERLDRLSWITIMPGERGLYLINGFLLSGVIDLHC